MSRESKLSASYVNPSQTTLPEIFSEIRTIFQAKEFDRVERVLMEREENVKRSLRENSIEAERLKNLYEVMEKRNGDLAMKNVLLENELQKYKRDCEEMEEKITRLSEETKMLSDREKRSEERYFKLKKDLVEVEVEKSDSILELNQKIETLNREKTWAEAEREVWKRKYKEVDVRVSKLEEDTVVILNGNPALKRKIEQELGSGEVMGEKVFGNEKSGDRAAVEKSLTSPGAGSTTRKSPKLESNIGAVVPALKRKIEQELGSGEVMGEKVFGNEKSRDRASVETVNANFVHEKSLTSLRAGSTARESPKLESNIGAENPNPLEVACGTGVTRRQQFVGKEEGSSKMIGSSLGVQCPKSEDVIEIDDSDDENPLKCTLTSVPNICASDFKSGETEITLNLGINEGSGQTGMDNGRICIRNSLKVCVSKRKRTSGSNNNEYDSDADDKAPIGSRKRIGLQEFGHEPEAIPASNRLAAPTVQVVKHHSQTSYNSSASDDSQEDDSDACVGNLIADLKRHTQHKGWAYNADMLRAFDKDDEVCMDAVCALYRLRIFKEKLAPTINLADVKRGIALAEFVIDGDEQGRRMKSASDLVKRFGPKTIDECRKLARRFADLLFDAFQKKKDPFFPQNKHSRNG